MLARLKELLFQNRSLRQTIAKNAFWLSISQVGSRLIRAVIIIYAARLLGATEYGVFAYALSIAGLFTIFSDIGINHLLIRELAKYPARRLHYFSTAFWIKLCLFLITATLIALLVPFISNIEAAVALIPFMILIVVFDGFRDFSLAVFRSKEKMELEALTMVSTNSAITLFGFLALLFAPTSAAFLSSYAIATGLGALLGFSFLKEEVKALFSHFDKYLVRPLLNAAWPIVMVGIIGTVMLNTDIIMLGWWESTEAIGFYSADQRVVLILYSLPAVLASSIFPAISRFIGQQDLRKVTLLMEKSVGIILLVAIPMVVGGIVLGTSIVELIYGRAYLPAAPSFQILILSLLINFPATLIGNAILAFNRQRTLAGYMGIAAAGNIFLNAALIPLYGIVGAAIATTVSQFFSNILAWRMLKRVNNFYTLRYLKKITAAAVLMGFFSFFLDAAGLNVLLTIVISAGLYFSFLHFLKEPLFEELIGLVSAIRKPAIA